MSGSDVSGLVIAHEVLERVRDDQTALMACLRGLKHTQDGEAKRRHGDREDALREFRQAHACFVTVAPARALLGIAKANLAAVYADMGRYQDAVPYAEDALAIVTGVPRLRLTEASARLTLGNAHAVLGRSADGATEYRRARTLLQATPGGECLLRILDANEKVIADVTDGGLGLSPKPGRRHRLLLFLAVAMVAVGCVLLMRSCS